MSRRLPWLLTWAVLALLAFAPEAPARSVGLIVSLIRQELVRYGLLTSAGSPAGTFDGEVSGDYFRGSIAAISTLVGIDPDDGATQTVTLSNDATGSGAISVTNLSASYSRHVKVVITDSGGPHDLEFPADWLWTNADGAPSATTASGKAVLWLESHGSAATDVIATWVDLQ